MTRFSERPLALAVRIKSAFSTSSMLVRVYLIRLPTPIMVSVIMGSTKWLATSMNLPKASSCM